MADEAASDIWVNSWFTIWYEPRATIRRIVDTDAHRFVAGIASWGATATARWRSQNSSYRIAPFVRAGTP